MGLLNLNPLITTPYPETSGSSLSLQEKLELPFSFTDLISLAGVERKTSVRSFLWVTGSKLGQCNMSLLLRHICTMPVLMFKSFLWNFTGGRGRKM